MANVITPKEKSFDIPTVGVKELNPDYDMGRRLKKIVVNAFKGEGITHIDDIHDCLLWAIGNDYTTVPYQKWGERIRQNHPDISPTLCLDADTFARVPIYIVMRAVARLFRQKAKVSPKSLGKREHKPIPPKYRTFRGKG